MAIRNCKFKQGLYLLVLLFYYFCKGYFRCKTVFTWSCAGEIALQINSKIIVSFRVIRLYQISCLCLMLILNKFEKNFNTTITTKQTWNAVRRAGAYRQSHNSLSNMSIMSCLKMFKFNLCVYVFQLLDVNGWNSYLDVHNSNHHCRRSKLASKLFLLTF